MSEKYQIRWLECTCGGCPMQWEGQTTDDRQVYIRYRHGQLSAGVSEVGDEDEFAAVKPSSCVFSQIIGDGFDGFMAETTMQDLLRDVFVFPNE